MKYLLVIVAMLLGSSAFAAGACSSSEDARQATIDFQKSFHKIERAGKLLELYISENAYDGESEQLGPVYTVNYFKKVEEKGVTKNYSGYCEISKSGDCGDAVDCFGDDLVKESL